MTTPLAPTARTAPTYALAMLSLLHAGGCHHGPSRTASVGTSAAGTGWQTVAPASTGYEVSLPGAPRIANEETTDFDGTRMVATVGTLEVFRTAIFGFTVLYAENGHAPDPTERASAARRRGREQAEEVVRSRRQFVHEGFPTFDVVVELPDDGLLFYTRTSVGRTRVFYSYVGIRAADEQKMQATVDYFLGSIHLHPSEARSPVGDGRLALGSWQYVYPPEGDFAAMLPGAPRYVKTQIPGEDDPIDVHAYGVQSEDRQHVFDVRVVAYGRRPTEEQVQEARARHTAQGHTVREERPIQLQGYAGRELVLESPTELVRVRFYMTNARLYEVRVRLPRRFEQSSAPAQARFFDSFRIL